VRNLHEVDYLRIYLNRDDIPHRDVVPENQLG
jgi:hypothetical protein